MKPLYKVIIVLVAAIVLLAALGSAFDHIATSPILTKRLNTQEGDQELPVPQNVPDLNPTDPVQNHGLPDLNETVQPPELNTSPPNNIGDKNITGTSNISGTVFIDRDGDGIPDPGEVQEDVGVHLYDQNGTLIGTTQTDEGGNYNFTGIDPGKYKINTFPGTNVNITGDQNRTITVGEGSDVNVDLNVDPNPTTAPTIDTITDIISPQSQLLIKKGVRFLVAGTVTTISMTPISGLPVMVFVAENKTTVDRYFIGNATVQNGIYSAVCLIPDDLRLGNYQLIARCLGNGTYRPSESDPAVKIMDGSIITIDCPDRMIMRSHSQLAFTLKENSSSRPVNGAEITFSIDTTPSNGGVSVTTDDSGLVTVDMYMENPGTHNITAHFAGNTDLYGTSANKTVTVLDVSVEAAPSDLVRGYDNLLFVLVHASELPVAFQAVVVSIQNFGLGAYMTDRDGRFNVTAPIPYYQALGPTKMVFDVTQVKRCALYLNVTSMTSMRADLEGNQINATLLDDHNQVILQMPILLQRTDQTNIEIGTSNVGSEFSVNPEQETDYVVKFNGSSIYEPSSAVVHYSPGAGSSDWLILGAMGALAVAAVIGFMLFRRRKVTGPGPEQIPRLPPIPMTRLSTSPYGITFPQIGEGMPQVWGENEPLLFQVTGEQGEMHLDIDGTGSTVNLDSGKASYTVSLAKGEHLMSLSGPLGTTTVAVRAVNYREETVRLYRTSFDSWKTHGNGISDSMTPRELQSTVERRLDPSLHGQLDVLISLFEIAQFSQRPIGRPEYESMFRASDRVT